MLTPFVVLAVDAVAGEPPARWHPVVWFGRASRALERRTYRPTVLAGAVHWAVLVGGAWCVGVGLRRVLGRRMGDTVAGVVSIAGAMLADEVAAVGAAVDAGHLATARHRVARIVGRDTARLDAEGVARAAIESLAENTVDAVTAPLCLLALAGAPAVLAHRAVNTLDAMIGHHSDRYERFGRVAARADDVVAWIPARLTAAAVVAVRPRRRRAIVATVRRDAGAHPSPNGGVVEAAFAAALGVRLGGTNRYGGVVEDRGRLGGGAAPTSVDVGRAITLARRVWWVTAAALASGRSISVVGRFVNPRR